METKHTPGPWTLEKIDDAEKTLVYYRVNSGKNTIGFAGVYHNRKLTDEEFTGNAKLIAAAPELLDACIEMYELLERAHKGSMLGKGIRKQALEAIKKATE